MITEMQKQLNTITVGSILAADQLRELHGAAKAAQARLRELIQLIEDAVGQKAQIRQLPDQPGDVPKTYADVEKAHRLLDYQPHTPIRDGVRKYAAWLAAQPG